MTAAVDQFFESKAAVRAVWILDVDPGLRRFLEKRLGPAEFEVVQFRRASELFSALLSVKPSLIVIDFAVVEKWGIDVIGLLRCRDEWRHIPLFVVSDETAMAFPIRVDAPVIYKPDRDGIVARVVSTLRPN